MPATCPGGGPGTSGSPCSLQRSWKPREAGRRCSGAYVHQLLLAVILLGAVFPAAVGLIDDHLSLLLTVVSLQVLLEVSQLLLGEWGRAYPREPWAASHLVPGEGHCQPREGCAKDPWAGLGGATPALTYTSHACTHKHAHMLTCHHAGVPSHPESSGHGYENRRSELLLIGYGLLQGELG